METAPQPSSFQCPDGVDPDLSCEVYGLVRKGSPRLALSVARGLPLIPFTSIISGAFTSTTQPQVFEANAAAKVSQDFLIEDIDYQITNTTGAPAGIDAINNEFFSINSGINVQLKVSGPGGGYNPIINFTPLWLARRKMHRRPWLITINEQILATFQASVSPLPFTCTVYMVFNGYSSQMKETFGMSAETALDRLRRMGYCVPKDPGCLP